MSTKVYSRKYAMSTWLYIQVEYMAYNENCDCSHDFTSLIKKLMYIYLNKQRKLRKLDFCTGSVMMNMHSIQIQGKGGSSMSYNSDSCNMTSRYKVIR